MRDFRRPENFGFVRSLGLFDSNDSGNQGIEAREARRDPLVQ